MPASPYTSQFPHSFAGLRFPLHSELQAEAVYLWLRSNNQTVASFKAEEREKALCHGDGEEKGVEELSTHSIKLLFCFTLETTQCDLNLRKHAQERAVHLMIFL